LRHASIGASPHPGQSPPRYRPAFPGASSCRRLSAWRWSSRPGVGRLIGPERAVKEGLSPSGDQWGGAGLGERSKALSEALRDRGEDMGERQGRAVEDDRGQPGTAPPEGRAARTGSARKRGLMEVAGLGLAGARGYGSSLKQSRRDSVSVQAIHGRPVLICPPARLDENLDIARLG
jgi:hypothetical protein